MVLTLFGLLGLLPAFLRAQISVNAGFGPSRDELLQNQQLVSLFGVSAATELAGCPTIVLAIGVVTLLALPFFVVLLGHDAISDDVDRGVSRWILVRASRAGLFVGKLLGIWASLSVLLLLLFVCSTAIVGLSGGVGLGDAARWSAKFWVTASAMCFPYLSLTMFLSAVMVPSTRALLLALGALFALSIGHGFVEHVSPAAARIWFPGSYDSFLLSVNGAEVWVGVGLVSAWGAFWVIAGIIAMSFRDV